VHLGDAELGGDLGLGHALEEPHPHHGTVSHGQRGEKRAQRLAVLDRFQAGIGDAEHRRHLRSLVTVVRRVQRHRGVGTRRLQTLDDVVASNAERDRELGHGRSVTVPLRQLLAGMRDRHAQLLQPPRNPYRPALVPKVPLDLAEDGRGGVGGELHAAVGVETVGGLDQPDHPDLHQILQWFATAAVLARDVVHQRHVQQDQLIADGQPLRLIHVHGGHPTEQDC
jgi:hypothetical protein